MYTFRIYLLIWTYRRLWLATWNYTHDVHWWGVNKTLAEWGKTGIKLREVRLSFYHPSAAAGEIVQHSWLGSLIWKHLSRDECHAVFQDYKISLPLMSQVNKWKVFAFVSRPASPASRRQSGGSGNYVLWFVIPRPPSGKTITPLRVCV